MIAKGEPLRSLVTETLTSADLFEHLHHPRIRARREVDRKSREAVLEALVVNLAHLVLAPSLTGRLAILGGNAAKGAGRYGNAAFGKSVRPLLDQMHEMDLLDFRLPRAMRGEVSSLAPTQRFASRVWALGITFSDFGHDDREEVIILTRKAGTRAAPSTDLIDYVETPGTVTLRKEVRKVNTFLAQADLAFMPDGLSPVIDTTQRLLKRRFVLHKGKEAERFDLGGRLFGGFWTNLRSSRRGNIRIEGERIADLDYASMFTRLAYAALGVTPPNGDLYALPGLEGYRSGIKLAFNIFLFDTKRTRAAWPKDDMGIGVGDDEDAKTAMPGHPVTGFEGLLPSGWADPERLRSAILQKHPALKAAFGHRLGFSLMFTESCILMAVLEELRERGIVALPLHDGLMVAQSRRVEAAEVMRAKAIKMTGAMFPVSEKA